MLQELNTTIKAWQKQVKADAKANAGMVTTMQYTSTDQLRDTLKAEAPLSEPFSPKVHKAFGEWLAEPVKMGWKYADERDPARNLYSVALPFFAADMAKAVNDHNQLNLHKFR